MDRFSASTPDGAAADAPTNHLLSLLPAADWLRWQPHLERVELRAGTSLCPQGDAPRHVYFPTTARVSLLHTTRDGACIEIAAIGNDGMVGLAAIMGGGSPPGEAVVGAAGQAFRVDSAWVRNDLQNPAVMQLLWLYTQALLTHVAQSAICTHHHLLEQRLCRCFLTSLDFAQGSTLNLTHEALACMLGVRREGVTVAAGKLQKAGVIEYARGHVQVLDRDALARQSCECYAAIKNEYARLLPRHTPPHAVADAGAPAWAGKAPNAPGAHARRASSHGLLSGARVSGALCPA